MYCTSCGNAIADGASFCTSCGAPVAAQARGQAGEPVQPQYPTPAVTQPAPSTANRVGRPRLAIALAIGLVILALGALWVNFGPKGGIEGRSGDAYDQAIFSSPVGSTVTFGTYEQNGEAADGPEPLEWIVVAKQGSRVQLVTSELVDYQPYDSENAGFAWVDSQLRSWLNDSVVQTAFTDEERALIRDTPVALPGQPADIYNPMVDTPAWDKAFLLSGVQANNLFDGDAERQAWPTGFAADHPGAPEQANWWLRSTGFECFGAERVLENGEIDGYGASVVDNEAYVRPSIWIAPPDSVDDPDAEGRAGAYWEVISYMLPEWRYAFADLDHDGDVELIVVGSTWDDPDNLGVYFYGYENAQVVYLGSVFLPGYSDVTIVRILSDNGAYLYGGEAPGVLMRVTLANGGCSAETLEQGADATARVREIGGNDGVVTLLLWRCDDDNGAEAILGGRYSVDGVVIDGASGGESTGSGAGKSSSSGQGRMLDEYRDQATPGNTSTVVNADNVGTRHDLNLFLSNFTEKSSNFAFDWNTCTDAEMCAFAIDHTRLNFPEAVEDASGEGVKNAAGELCGERIAFETFAKYPQVFLKKDFGEGNVVEPCVVRGGYVYFPASGWHVPNGVAYVTSTTDIGNGRALVTFDVYGDGVDYVVTDESYYTCSAEELQEKLGVNGISRTGNAIVEPMDDGSVAPFKLWAFESN